LRCLVRALPDLSTVLSAHFVTLTASVVKPARHYDSRDSELPRLRAPETPSSRAPDSGEPGRGPTVRRCASAAHRPSGPSGPWSSRPRIAWHYPAAARAAPPLPAGDRRHGGMVLEHALLSVKPGAERAFEAAFAQAKEIIAGMAGRSVDLVQVRGAAWHLPAVGRVAPAGGRLLTGARSTLGAVDRRTIQIAPCPNAGSRVYRTD
jgi:hypothetical protein